MKFPNFQILACVTLLLASGPTFAKSISSSLLIKNVTVLSAHLNQPRQNSDVLIEDGRVSAIRQSGTTTHPGKTIDGTGKFLIPGLIDSHVHLGHNLMVNRADQDIYAALDEEYRRQLPRSFLYYGFTSLIDLDYSAKRSGWIAGAEFTPNVYHCGRGVRTAGGYGPAFVPHKFVHKAFPNLVYEHQHKAHWPSQFEPEGYTVQAAVQRVVQSGAICLKTYVEAGFGGVFEFPTPSADVLSELSRAAHENGLVFVVHANSADAWKEATAAGADVIAHGLWHWDGDRRDPSLSDAALSALQDASTSGVAVQPTLRVVQGEKDTLTWQLLNDARIRHVLPTALRDYLQSEKGRWSQRALRDLYLKHSPYKDLAPEALIEVSIKRATDTMVAFQNEGGELLFGSDTPAQEGIGNPPGLNGYLEIIHWEEAGIPLEQIFRSITLGNAQKFRIDGDVGTLEVGKRADLLLLNSNPLLSASAYDDISTVILNGRAIDRSDLSALSLQPQ